MWSYYGAKTNVIQHYPPPKHDKIIEPFAGSARYALRYFERDILIVDKYAVIINIWKWLQKCSPADVLRLPRMLQGEHVDNYTWDCQEAKDFMGFVIGFPTDSPRRTATIRLSQRPNCVNFTLNRIANNLHKIRHWEIVCGSYTEIPNEKATWFIDPPYQLAGGKDYKESGKNIDFDFLATWCLEREGQQIVCEAAGATWLNFQPLVNHQTRNGRQKEVVYLNEPSAFDYYQLNLF